MSLARANDNVFANWPPAPLHVERPPETLFEYVRASDRKRITCELRFRGESYAWEVQFIEVGFGEFFARGGFVLRELAAQWAEREGNAMKNSRPTT